YEELGDRHAFVVEENERVRRRRHAHEHAERGRSHLDGSKERLERFSVELGAGEDQAWSEAPGIQDRAVTARSDEMVHRVRAHGGERLSRKGFAIANDTAEAWHGTLSGCKSCRGHVLGPFDLGEVALELRFGQKWRGSFLVRVRFFVGIFLRGALSSQGFGVSGDCRRGSSRGRWGRFPPTRAWTASDEPGQGEREPRT